MTDPTAHIYNVVYMLCSQMVSSSQDFGSVVKGSEEGWSPGPPPPFPSDGEGTKLAGNSGGVQ